MVHRRDEDLYNKDNALGRRFESEAVGSNPGAGKSIAPSGISCITISRLIRFFLLQIKFKLVCQET